MPADVVGEPRLAPVRPTVNDLVATERTVQFGNKIEPHALPMLAELRQQHAVQRHTAALLLRDRPLKLGPEHRVREWRAQRRNDVRQQPRQRTRVVFTIVQEGLLFMGAERRTL